MKISEIMRHPAIVVRESDSIEHAAMMMLQNDLRGLPVVDENGKIKGFISASDYLAREKGFPFTRFRALQLFGKWIQEERIEDIYEDARSLPVNKIMSSPAFTVKEDDTVQELVRLMVQYGFSSLPVVRDDVPVGIVARLDLLKLICKLDDDAHEMNEKNKNPQ